MIEASEPAGTVAIVCATMMMGGCAADPDAVSESRDMTVLQAPPTPPSPPSALPEPPPPGLGVNVSGKPWGKVGAWTILEHANGCSFRRETTDASITIELPRGTNLVGIRASAAQWRDIEPGTGRDVVGETRGQPDWASRDNPRGVVTTSDGTRGTITYETSISSLMNRLLLERDFILTPAELPAVAYPMNDSLAALDAAARCTDGISSD